MENVIYFIFYIVNRKLGIGIFCFFDMKGLVFFIKLNEGFLIVCRFIFILILEMVFFIIEMYRV